MTRQPGLPQISFAGIPTFMRAEIAEIGDIGAGQVGAVGAPLDTTTEWTRGAAGGPRGIREHSLHLLYSLQASYDDDFVDLETRSVFRSPAPGTLFDLGDLNVYPSQIEKTARSFREGIREIAAMGPFPLILGGDHYVSFPCCQGFVEAVRGRNGGKVGYVGLGCDLGLWLEHPIWGTDWSGSRVRRLIEHEVIEPRNVALLGASGMVPVDQYQYAKTNGLTLFTAEDIRREGMAELTRRALEEAGDGCETIYVSLGLDVLDSSQVPGIGATVIGGLHPRDLGAAAEVLAQDPRIGALDVVEVAPSLDRTGRSERLAAYALGTFLEPRTVSTASPST